MTTIQSNTPPPILRPGDLAECGNVVVMGLDQVMDTKPEQDFLTGWDDARVNMCGVLAPDGKTGVLVFSLAYEYSSAEAAKAAAMAVKEPGLVTVQKKDADALSEAAVATLKSHPVTWRVWQGLDSEGLPTSVLMIQSRSYVNLIWVSHPPAVAEFAQMLVDVAAVKVARGNVGADLPAVGMEGAS
jgi:hypothetical protein